MLKFQKIQREFIEAVRQNNPKLGPSDVDPKRLQIYSDLIFDNIRTTLANAFPVLTKLHSDEQWAALTRDFISKHRSQTPYFYNIPEEFIDYLETRNHKNDYLFLLELAHYEWVELALSMSDQTLPPAETLDLNAGVPILSPLAWVLHYQFPVHEIGPDHIPTSAPETPSFIIVYRNRANEVHFMKINAVSARLITYIEEQYSPQEAIASIIKELNHPEPQQAAQAGMNFLQDLVKADIIVGVKHV